MSRFVPNLPAFVALVGLLVITGVADVATTLRGLARGGWEQSPGVRAVLELAGPIGFFGLKAVVVALVVMLVRLVPRVGWPVGWAIVMVTAADSVRNVVVV